jgi:hypothetical protein
VQVESLVNSVMEVWVPLSAVNALSSCTTGSFSRRAQHHEVSYLVGELFSYPSHLSSCRSTSRVFLCLQSTVIIIKHKYFASIATKYSLRIIMFTTCFGQRGPSSSEHYIRHYNTCRLLPVCIWKYTDLKH